MFRELKSGKESIMFRELIRNDSIMFRELMREREYYVQGIIRDESIMFRGLSGMRVLCSGDYQG